MSAIQYLIDWDPLAERILLSVFFHDNGHGLIRGMYFGDAGGGCRNDASFRMTLSEDGRVRHFLECDDPSDEVFLRDRIDDHGTHDQTVPLDDADTHILVMLQTMRGSWWSFTEDEGIRIAPARLGQLLPGNEPQIRTARSTPLDLVMLQRIAECWSLSDATIRES